MEEDIQVLEEMPAAQGTKYLQNPFPIAPPSTVQRWTQPCLQPKQPPHWHWTESSPSKRIYRASPQQPLIISGVTSLSPLKRPPPSTQVRYSFKHRQPRASVPLCLPVHQRTISPSHQEIIITKVESLSPLKKDGSNGFSMPILGQTARGVKRDIDGNVRLKPNPEVILLDDDDDDDDDDKSTQNTYIKSTIEENLQNHVVHLNGEPDAVKINYSECVSKQDFAFKDCNEIVSEDEMKSNDRVNEKINCEVSTRDILDMDSEDCVSEELTCELAATDIPAPLAGAEEVVFRNENDVIEVLRSKSTEKDTPGSYHSGEEIAVRNENHDSIMINTDSTAANTLFGNGNHGSDMITTISTAANTSGAGAGMVAVRNKSDVKEELESTTTNTPAPDSGAEKIALRNENSVEKKRVKPTMVKPTTSTTSTLTLEDFIKQCLLVDDSKEMHQIMEKKIKKHHAKCDPAFLTSSAFQKLLRESLMKIESDQKNLYVYISTVVEELKARKTCAKEDQKSVSQSPKKSNAVDYNALEAARNQAKIKKLSKVLDKLQKVIKRLEEKEVDWDDDEDSNYIILQRYKSRAVKVFNKLCEYTKESKSAGRIRRIHFSGTDFPQVNKCVEKFVNETGQFPDIIDILDVIKKVNSDDNMNLSDNIMEEIAKKAFKEVGEELQRLRKHSVAESLLSFVDGISDPVETDEELKKKLTGNEKHWQKINEVIDEYAKKADEKKETESEEQEGRESEEESSNDSDMDDVKSDVEEEDLIPLSDS